MVDKRLAGLEERAPALVTLLSSSNVGIHTPERFVESAVTELAALLDGGLMGVKEVSEATGISGPNVYDTKGMPKPRAVLACGSVWDAHAIAVFVSNRRDHRKKAVHA